jgi:hypothetical protein
MKWLYDNWMKATPYMMKSDGGEYPLNRKLPIKIKLT